MSNSLAAFTNQLGLVDQLITIHGRLQRGRGRRHQLDALHRAGVVLTVAAWQAYVEKVLAEGVAAIAADMANPAAPAPAWALHTFQMRRAAVLNLIKKFNTPDDTRVRDLFQDCLGFNPWLSWGWVQGRRNWTSKEVRERTNGWVRVRHSIAHGFDLPADLAWLRVAAGPPRLTLNLLQECRRHFVHLASQTDFAFADFLVASHALTRPW
jgi:hypothetical protein